MTQATEPQPLIRQALSLLCEPGQVVELRVPGTGQGTQTGYFNDMQMLLEAAVKLDSKGPGVYITLNPINPDLLARGANQVKTYAKQGESTGDKDILYRRCFPIDFDAIRPAGISSTDEEHAAAIDKAVECREWLTERGWPEPILADSGNGAHLPYRVDLPNDEASKKLLEQCLKALGTLFDDEQVKVDQTTYNASRIWKLYGTTVCKGDHLPDRPHRMARILEAPERLAPVGLELLQQLAALAPVTKKPEPRSATKRGNGGTRLGQGDYATLDVVGWFEAHNRYGRNLAPGKHSVLCPWADEHTDQRSAEDSDTVIWEATDGQWPTFFCAHDHCVDQNLKSVMDLWGDTDSFCSRDFQPNANGHSPGHNPPTEEAPGISVPRLLRLSDVEPEEVRWLWPGYVPYGKVTLLAGDPGLGKSWATLDLAARLTVGVETPDRLHLMEQSATVLLTAEDGLADTVRPRIDTQGGDASLVHVLDAIVDPDGHERLPSLVEDIAMIEQVVTFTRAHLVIIDPLNVYMGRTDSHVDAQVRRALTPLAKMAERTGAAILVVMHLNQATLQPALYRVQGSIGYVGAARSVLLVVRDKDNPAQRVVAPIKANLAKEMPAVGFTITDEPALAWQGVVEVNIAELLAATAPEEGSAREEAKTFLAELLANEEVPAKQVLAEARECGIAVNTLRRAAKDMGIDIAHVGHRGKKGGGSWVWRMPLSAESHQDDQDPLHVKSGYLDSEEGVNKIPTLEDSTDTKSNKIPTKGTQGGLGTLINPNDDRGHLVNEELPSEEGGGHLDSDEPGGGEVRF